MKEIIIIVKKCAQKEGAKQSGWTASTYGSQYGFKPKRVFAKTAKEALMNLSELLTA